MGYAGSTTEISLRNGWRTPLPLFRRFHAEYNFSADVAASVENALLPRFFTLEENALDGFWGDVGGIVWCNPPYDDIAPWVWGAEQSARMGTGTVMLVPADPGVGWFDEATETANRIIWITGGRVSFLHPATGAPINDNMKGSVMLCWLPEAWWTGIDTQYISLSLIEKQAKLIGRDYELSGIQRWDAGRR